MKRSGVINHSSLNHIAFIMDGNGRWAKKRNKPRTYGHKVAVSNLIKLINECYLLNIHGVSLFAFSTENWSRPKSEIEHLFKYLEEFFNKHIDELNKKNIKIIISGDYHKLPKRTSDIVSKAINITKKNNKMFLNICLNYGGQDEIINVVNKLLKSKKKHISKKEFFNQLSSYELGEIDLMIRTSGELRISNFMLYSLAYSELIFVDKYFPDFTKDDLIKCIDIYNKRNRRYGGLR